MKPILSIILPSIRPSKLLEHYESIEQSTSRVFELIIVSPYNLPKELQEKNNVKYFKDFGSPNRAQCIAASLAEGDVITWSCDDGIFVKNGLDFAIDELGGKDNDIVVAKYIEGSGLNMEQDNYYKLALAYPFSPFIPNYWWIFNIAILYRSYYESLGGFDCIFETTAVAHADFAARCQRDGANVKLINKYLLKCEHMLADTGDHGPIHYSTLQHDQPLYQKIYNDPECLKRKKIPLDNWKNSPSIWTTRFGDSK